MSSSTATKNERVRRIAVMGFRAVGKSSLTIQFVEHHFVDQYRPTIENTFSTKMKAKGLEFSVKIVDTSGQDEYSIIPNNLGLGMHGYVLVYAVSSRQSFDIVKIIRDKLLNLMGTDTLPMVLVGNKKDLHLERKIAYEEGKKLAEEWCCPFVEASAKQNDEVFSVFSQMLNEIEKKADSPGATQKDKDCTIL